MINFTEVSCHQTTEEGIDSPWDMKLGDRLLLKLPPSTTVQETFEIRDAIGLLCEEAYQEGVKFADKQAEIRMNKIVANGDAQLDALKQENERLSAILETTLGEEV